MGITICDARTSAICVAAAGEVENLSKNDARINASYFGRAFVSFIFTQKVHLNQFYSNTWMDVFFTMIHKEICFYVFKKCNKCRYIVKH